MMLMVVMSFMFGIIKNNLIEVFNITTIETIEQTKRDSTGN